MFSLDAFHWQINRCSDLQIQRLFFLRTSDEELNNKTRRPPDSNDRTAQSVMTQTD